MVTREWKKPTSFMVFEQKPNILKSRIQLNSLGLRFDFTNAEFVDLSD